LAAEKGEMPEGEARGQLARVLGQAPAPGVAPEQEGKGVAWSELRAVVPGERAAEAKETGVFFEKLVESQDWARGLAPRVEKQIPPVKPELQAEVRREAGVSMAEAQPEMGSSQNLGAVKLIPVPPRKHLSSVPLLRILFRSKRPFRTPSKRQEFS
jgi:hypothetical protein